MPPDCGFRAGADSRPRGGGPTWKGAILGAEYVVYLSQQNPGTFVAVGEPISRNLSGLAFPRSQAPLRDAVAGALGRLMANGTYRAILAKHGLERQALSAVSIDAGE